MVGASSVSNGNSELVRAMFESSENVSIQLSTKVESIRKDGNVLMIETKNDTLHRPRRRLRWSSRDRFSESKCEFRYSSSRIC